MKKILIVCTANIRRSPTAEAIFNALAEDANFVVRTESSGVAVLEGRPTAPKASEALEGRLVFTPKPDARVRWTRP